MSQMQNYLFELPIIGHFIKYIFDIQPVIGNILVGIIAVLLINGIVKRELDINLLKMFVQYMQGKDKNYRYDKERNQFYSKSTEPNFVEWQHKVLKNIYTEIPFVNIFGREYPVSIQRSAINYKYPFNESMAGFAELKTVQVPELKMDKGQQYYFKIMSSTIKRPNLIGFELDHYLLTDGGEIQGFKANTCQYKHTVSTSHILEYELYKIFVKKGKSLADRSSEDILQKLPYRNKIHEGQTQLDVITKGRNRHSLLSVQMMIVCFDPKIQDYRTLIFKRSEDVAIKPNYWQIIPAGGYEIFEKEQTTNKYIIEQNFSIELALFRELIEEVFNGKDFEANEHGDVNEIIHKHPDIVELENLLINGDAQLEFLGNVTDIVSLRPELSFVLVIDNPEFIRKNFKINFEGTDFQMVKVNDLPKMLDGELLYPSSAGLIALAKESHLFRERNLLQDINVSRVV
ncbi:hypothetical protein CVD28_20795 [Bacillus sp. M6-12]|uniref:hypothetical protein n=1 Tax=Bacillus sp. M6-12 TaxID=2054166 RepID=UPI000C760A43|nr:hypothetical protein [Bacillus sp. M6-12]PLS15743.1 hypothetical protein CVD28_20795 [Bacillus sp. M6-12]